MLRLSSTRWIVRARGYAATITRIVRANWTPDRLGGDPAQVASGLGFDDPEQVRGAAAPVLVVPFGEVARPGGPRRAHVGVQQEGTFVDADHRLARIEGALVERQHVFHPRDILRRQLTDAPPSFRFFGEFRGILRDSAGSASHASTTVASHLRRVR